MSKPKTSIASDMQTTGEVEKSSVKLPASFNCHLEAVRAYSSVMNKNARWPSKNFTDVVTQYLRGREPFNVVVISAPTVDITNLNTKRLSQRQCEEKAIESSKNMISLAEKTLGEPS